MAHWPSRLGYARVVSAARLTTGGVGSTYDYKSVTGGVVGTKGTWVELIGSTSQDAHWIEIIADGSQSSTSDTGMLLDIGVGAALAEKVIIPDLGVGFTTSYITSAVNNPPPCIFRFPLYIPAGSRIAARNAGQIANDVVNVAIDLYGGLPPGGFPVGNKVDTYGIADPPVGSKGVTLTSGNPSNTKGAWAEIEDSTSQPIKALAISIQGSSNTISAAKRHLVDIGVGASPNEKVVIPDILVTTLTSETIVAINRGMWPLDIPLPAGTRLVCRTSCSGTGSDTDLSVHLHGVR